MDRWTGILKVPLCLESSIRCRVAASLCVSLSSKTLVVPKANAVFFNGDRVEGTGNPVIDKLSDIQNIAQILVSKFGASVNAWVIEASTYNGSFAVYNEFIPSVNKWGEPQAYKPNEFPASTSLVSLLSNFCAEADLSIDHHNEASVSSCPCPPKTIMLGFSKGGVVLNQLITELGFLSMRNWDDPNQSKFPEFTGNQVVPNSAESLLDSIAEIHFVDVGLNAPGAYLIDDAAIERVAKWIIERDKRMRFVLHGTPRQWNDKRRAWIREEKNKLCRLLELCEKNTEGRLEVSERTYFDDKRPDLQMHFQIIEELVIT